MSRRRSHIALRRPIYIGCEGASEVGYASFLQDLARATNLPVHLHIEELGPGAGDPLSRIELAVLRLTLMQKKRNVPAERFVLLDFDQAEREPHRAARAVKLAADNAISIVWQRPCFEAVLLRHLVGRAAHRPPDTHAAMRALEREWPHYRKPMRRSDLARLIDADAVRRAAHVEEELQALLACIGLLSEA